jgi:hypothetical protein
MPHVHPNLNYYIVGVTNSEFHMFIMLCNYEKVFVFKDNQSYCPSEDKRLPF